MMALRRKFAVLSAVVASLVVSAQAFAVETGDYDWASDLTTGLTGITAGVVASIAAVFGIAVLVRLSFRAARIALKALGFIK